MIRQLTEPGDASQRHCNQPLCLEPGTQSCSPFPVSPHLIGCLATRKLATNCGAPYHSYHAVCLKRCDGHHHQHDQSRAQDCGWLKWESACSSSWNRRFLVKQPDGITAFGGCLPLADLHMKSRKATEGLGSPPLSSQLLKCNGATLPPVPVSSSAFASVLSFAPNDDYPLECWEVSCLSTLNTDVTVREIPPDHFSSQI